MNGEKNEDPHSKHSLKESIIEDNELPFDLENTKKEITENSISPIINDIVTERDRDHSKINTNLNENENVDIHLNINKSIRNERNQDVMDFESKKMKLVNVYHSLLKLRQNLIIKEKDLIEKEKNLIIFEKILKSNEAILKNNIEQFDIYIKTKIEEIKNQFKQIEQIQMKKEIYLKQKEEEIINFKNKFLLNNNYKSYNTFNINDMNLKNRLKNNNDIHNEQLINEIFNNHEDYYTNNNYNKRNINNEYDEDDQNNNFYCENCSKFNNQFNNNTNNQPTLNLNEKT